MSRQCRTTTAPLLLALLLASFTDRPALAGGPGSAPPLPPPKDWSLLQNSPDWFCPAQVSTEISFATVTTTHLLLQVWNPDSTRLVRTLIDGVWAAGRHSVRWDGRDSTGALVAASGTYPYRMIAGDGSVLFSDTKYMHISCSADVAGDAAGERSRVRLSEPWPNPCAPCSEGVRMWLDLGAAARVRAEVFDLRGRLVARLPLELETLPAGRHKLAWDGRTTAGTAAITGLYWLRVVAGGVAQCRAMLLIR